MKIFKFLIALVVAANICAADAAKKKIVLVAGTPSHGKGEHEFNAGVQLMQQALKNQPNVAVSIILNGWPKDPHAFDGADAILIYSDGGGGHPAVQDGHLKDLDALASKGVGIAMAHYAVEVPKENGGPEFLRWLGGYFETFWSVNPTWTADFTELPKHPITRGVKPFKIHDEWYYNMRFAEKGVTPILVAVPPDSTRQGRDDAHGGNEFVRNHKGRPEVMAWAYERPDGGRGFGFTGGHYHKNWGDENFRKLFLNALLWTAKAEVPANGVESTVTPEDLAKNQDPKR
jgi:type 1 glutamine amidotransferase